MTLHRAYPRQHAFSMRGFSMLEVLIAVLVFSLGMIGLAGLLIFAIQSNHVAYLRTQATFLAHNMADRMGANPAGVWNGNYNISAIKAAGTPIASCTSGCSPADLATHDIDAWSQQLHTFLPAAKADITCTNNTAYKPSADEINGRPPYGGTCKMTVYWSEAGAGKTNAAQQLTFFNWVFQP